jgi:hypothetical protein
MGEIGMKFFKVKQQPQKVNPISKKLVESTMNKLGELGVVERHHQVNCTNKLMRTFASFVSSLKNCKDPEVVSVKYTTDMRATITAYGITDTLKQEEIILNFIDVLSEYMENPNGI